MSNDTELKPPCDCCELSAGGYWQQTCDCQNNGDLAEAAVWCDQQNTRPTPSEPSVVVDIEDLKDLWGAWHAGSGFESDEAFDRIEALVEEKVK